MVRDRPPSTRSRILDATMTAMAAHGLSGLTLEDVAGAAGVSRQTVYRHFGSREGLVTAAILREEQGFLERITAAADTHADIERALGAGLAAGLQTAREHPLLDRLLAEEPEALLPFLTTGAGPLLSAARPAIEGLFSSRLPDLPADACRAVADMATRLFISYAVNPPPDDPAGVAADLAALLVQGLEQLAGVPRGTGGD